MRWLSLFLLGLLILLTALWAALALFYMMPLPQGWPRLALAVAFPACTVLAFALFRHRGWTLLIYCIMLTAIIAGFLLQVPSNDKPWQPDVAVLPHTSVGEDGTITIHNVRNAVYRGETDYTLHYEDRQYRLEDLQTLDMFLSYWSGEAIAHVIMSFGFSDGRYLAVSIETRKAEGQEYSALQGFFRQYELIYVVADERDVIGLRTNHRGETVYLYRVNVRPETVRRVFLRYLQQIDALHRQPAFYNALLSNCATNVVINASPDGSLWDHLDWRILLSGYLDRLAYDLELIDTRLPFAKLRTDSRINDAARAADGAVDFSRWIRRDLPMPPPLGATRSSSAQEFHGGGLGGSSCALPCRGSNRESIAGAV